MQLACHLTGCGDQTGVGLELAKLKKHQDDAVQRMAKDVKQDFKRQAQEEMARTKGVSE